MGRKIQVLNELETKGRLILSAFKKLLYKASNVGCFIFLGGSALLVPNFVFSQNGQQSPKENYEKKYLFDLKIEKNQVDDVFVDANENYYVLHSKKSDIEIFDKAGSFVKKIDWENPYPNIRYHINVDENGNILIFGANQINIPGFILDKNGKLIASFKVAGAQVHGFSNGIVYQVTDGKVLYALPLAKSSSPKQKIYFKDFDERYDEAKVLEETKKHIYNQNHNLHLPKKVGDFIPYGGLWAVTNDGTSFAFYATRPIIKPPQYTKQNPYQIRELFKFGPNYDLVGVIPTAGWPFVNLETGQAYEHHSDEKTGIVKIYRWDKTD